jgi:hypothetical protein
VTVTAKDAAGNQSATAFTVTVILSDTAHTALAVQGDAVPGAGIDPRIPAGAVWVSFGVPAISAAGKVAFLGTWTTRGPIETGSGLFVDGTLWASVGGASPLSGATFERFKDPVFASDDDLLLVPAVLAGAGVTVSSDRVLLGFDPAPRIIVREGDATGLGDGVQLSKFIAVNAAGGKILFVARVRGGRPAANATNNVAVFVAEPAGLVSWVRTGQTMLGRKVKNLRLFTPVSGSMGQARGEWSDAGLRFIADFTDRTQAIIEASAPGVYQALAGSGEAVGSVALKGAKWKSFGQAVSNTSGGELSACLATLEAGVGGVTAVNARGIFLGANGEMEPLARLGDSTPDGTVGVFSALSDPVLAADGTCLAFLGKTKFGRMIIPGVFAKYGDEPFSTVATLATNPPGVPLAVRWKSFTSVAAPGGGLGPLFIATLQGVGVEPGNDKGLWVVDTTGTLRCLVREGDQVAGRTVKTFNILRAVPGTPGVTRAFNAQTQIVWLATFWDGSTALVETAIP